MSSWAAMLPDDIWENIFSFLTANSDRNAVSLVCRDWFQIDRRSRRRILIVNCDAVKPAAVVDRFTGVRAAYIKGSPWYDESPIPTDWGCRAESWVAAMAKRWPQLEEVRLKRMVVNDDCLKLISEAFKKLNVLILHRCEGVTNKGLAAIAANCRNLMELELPYTFIEENYATWLNYFPESFTSLVKLDLTKSLNEEIIPVVECLVSRCTNIQSLRILDPLPLPSLINLVDSAPQLIVLETHLLDFQHSASSEAYLLANIEYDSPDYDPKLFSKLELAFARCQGIRSLHLFQTVTEQYLPAIYSVCNGLTSLNLDSCRITRRDLLIQLVSRCKNLQRLQVDSYFGNDGLDTVASSCKLLQELHVICPAFPLLEWEEDYSFTEHGLVTVSVGCPMLQYIEYGCNQMTNAALVAVAQNRPNLTCFRLRCLKARAHDYETQEPFDKGFSAIVESCKDLRRLSLTGSLTDDAFRSIGANANRLERLSIAYTGQSAFGVHYILSGCKSLRKLDIWKCPFGENVLYALLLNAAKLNGLQALRMESCSVSLGECRFLAQVMPRLNVEVFDEIEGSTLDAQPDDFLVENLYVYNSLAGRISNNPPSVWTVSGVVRQ